MPPYKGTIKDGTTSSKKKRKAASKSTSPAPERATTATATPSPPPGTGAINNICSPTNYICSPLPNDTPSSPSKRARGSDTIEKLQHAFQQGLEAEFQGFDADVSITEKFQRIFKGLEAGFEGFKLDEQQRKEFVAALAAQYNECLVTEPPSQAETIGAEISVEPPPIPEGMVPIPHVTTPPEELGAFPVILARNLDPAFEESNNNATTPAIRYNPKAFLLKKLKDGTVVERSPGEADKSKAAATARQKGKAEIN